MVSRTVGIAFVVLAVVSCGGKPEPARKVGGVQAPDWIEGGGGSFRSDKGRVLRAVGSASGIKNVALARGAADNRARAELGKIMEVYSASLMKDYMASTTAGDMKSSSEEQHVEQAIKTFSATTLSGVQIIDHWVHPDGTWYALAELDLAAMNGALDRARDLDGKVRDFVRKNAERSMASLDAEEKKRAPAASPAPVKPAPAAPVEPARPAAAPALTCTAGQVQQCGRCVDVAASLDKMRWELPCAPGASGAVCRSTVVRPTRSLKVGGTPDASYDIVLRFRGVVEQNSYAGGVADGYWYTGGRADDGHYNIYQMTVSAPAQVFFLNAGRANIMRSWAIDYQRTVRLAGGADITLTADDQDRELIVNRDDRDQRIVIPDVPPAPAAFDGQFIQMDVLSVIPASTVTCPQGERR